MLVSILFIIKLQVQFNKVYPISGIATQGRSLTGGQVTEQYVTRYKLRYSFDCTTFFTYRAPDGSLVYDMSHYYVVCID